MTFPTVPLEPADLDHLFDVPRARGARWLVVALVVAAAALAWWLGA